MKEYLNSNSPEAKESIILLNNRSAWGQIISNLPVKFYPNIDTSDCVIIKKNVLKTTIISLDPGKSFNYKIHKIDDSLPHGYYIYDTTNKRVIFDYNKKTFHENFQTFIRNRTVYSSLIAIDYNLNVYKVYPLQDQIEILFGLWRISLSTLPIKYQYHEDGFNFGICCGTFSDREIEIPAYLVDLLASTNFNIKQKRSKLNPESISMFRKITAKHKEDLFKEEKIKKEEIKKEEIKKEKQLNLLPEYTEYTLSDYLEGVVPESYFGIIKDDLSGGLIEYISLSQKKILYIGVLEGNYLEVQSFCHGLPNVEITTIANKGVH